MTTNETAGIDSLLKEIRKYTEGSQQRTADSPSASGYRTNAGGTTATSASYLSSSANQVRPGLEPPNPLPATGERSTEEARPKPAPRSPITSPVERKNADKLDLDNILAKISSVTGIRKGSSDSARSPASASNTNHAPIEVYQPKKPAAPIEPMLPAKTAPPARSDGGEISSRDRYQAELARLDAEISKFKASMQEGGSNAAARQATVDTSAPAPKAPSSLSVPTTPTTRSGVNSFLLHPDGDISQVGAPSFEGAKAEDLQRSISRMQEALKMSREMRAQLIPDTPTKTGDRRSSGTGSFIGSPAVFQNMPTRASPAPHVPTAIAQGEGGNGSSIIAGGVVPPWEKREEPSASPLARRPENRSPVRSSSSDATYFQGDQPAGHYHSDRLQPYHPLAPAAQHERMYGDMQGAIRQAPPPPPPQEMQRSQPPMQHSRPPLPEPQPQQDPHELRIQHQLRQEINNYPVDPGFRQHLNLMIQDGSIRSSKELRAYIEQQFRSSGYPQRAPPPPPPPQNLSRSVDMGGSPAQGQQYGRAMPRAVDNDADILSRSFDEINRLASGAPPIGANYMAPPPPQRLPVPSSPMAYYNNRGPSPMHRPHMSPGPMQQQPVPHDGYEVRMRGSQDPMQLNPPYGLHRPLPAHAASPRQAYPQHSHPPMPALYRQRDPSPFGIPGRGVSAAPLTPQHDDDRAYIPLSEVPQDIAASLISEGYSQGAML